MTNQYTALLGKTVRRIAQMRGGGSALPGLFVEKINPHFVADTLESLPRGVVVVSGTNGKTTTTKIVVAMLESQGLRVFTNRTGSNFVRGVAAALLGEVDMRGQLHADIAVLELDEAHAVHFVRSIKPRYSLLLNVMRDQLDRFGEIDATAKLLHVIAENTTDTVVINRDDPRLSAESFAGSLGNTDVRGFGTAVALRQQFPSDDDMHTALNSKNQSKLSPSDTSLDKITNDGAVISWNGQPHDITLKLTGVYNILNAAAAVALVRVICSDTLETDAMLTALSDVTPAFGRGESIKIDGQPCELILVKNPAGFRLGLSSFNPDGVATMIAVNDNYADGRDMSWLWDVNFDGLRPAGVSMVSGIRAYDMALRLQYAKVEIDSVETDLERALNEFIKRSDNQPKRIYCTYTAMLKLRGRLAKRTQVEKVRA